MVVVGSFFVSPFLTFFLQILEKGLHALLMFAWMIGHFRNRFGRTVILRRFYCSFEGKKNCGFTWNIRRK